jgi:8-oxo-dGTP pyrophosphatase MutT (NUDIX family)
VVVRLREYYRDPNAPRAHDVLPAAFAAVRNVAGEVLLVRRIDDGYWELPGGRLEVGESAAQAVIREVAEESGVTIALTGLSGVYSDPTHFLLDPDRTVHQQLALCFHAVPVPPDTTEAPRPDGIETKESAWRAPTATSPPPRQAAPASASSDAAQCRAPCNGTAGRPARPPERRSPRWCGC